MCFWKIGQKFPQTLLTCGKTSQNSWSKRWADVIPFWFRMGCYPVKTNQPTHSLVGAGWGLRPKLFRCVGVFKSQLNLDGVCVFVCLRDLCVRVNSWAGAACASAKKKKMKLAAKREQELIFFLQAALWEKKGHLQLGFMNNVQTSWKEEARLVVLLTLRCFFIPAWYVNNTLRRASIFHKHASRVLKVEGCVSAWDTGNINPQTSQTERCFWVRSSPLQTQPPSHRRGVG